MAPYVQIMFFVSTSVVCSELISDAHLCFFLLPSETSSTNQLINQTNEHPWSVLIYCNIDNASVARLSGLIIFGRLCHVLHATRLSPNSCCLNIWTSQSTALSI